MAYRHRTCEVCGTNYRPSHHKQRTCGRQCGAELRRREGWESEQAKAMRKLRSNGPKCRVHFMTCAECRQIFTSPRRRKFCSRRCSRLTNWRISNARRAKAPSHPCMTCGLGELCARPWKCQTCKEASRHMRRKRDKRRRRALKFAAKSEHYTLEEIALRDGRRCGLCHERVTMSLAVPHSRAPTIDHIIPLASGGDDTRVNVQLAHFSCNWMKRDRGGGEQLALIG